MKAPPGPGVPVGSPCTNICRMNAASGCCEGCCRTLDEIAGWGTMSDEARRVVWSQLAQRRLRQLPLRHPPRPHPDLPGPAPPAAP